MKAFCAGAPGLAEATTLIRSGKTVEIAPFQARALASASQGKLRPHRAKSDKVGAVSAVERCHSAIKAGVPVFERGSELYEAVPSHLATIRPRLQQGWLLAGLSLAS